MQIHNPVIPLVLTKSFLPQQPLCERTSKVEVWLCNELTSLRNFLHSFEYLPLVNDYKSKPEMPSHNI